MKYIILSASAMLLWCNTAKAQCESVDTLNETFNDFTTFPESCWQTIGNVGYAGFSLTDGYGDGNQIMFYGSTNVGNAFYIVTPELSSVSEGGHYLSFDGTAVSALGNGLTIQFGTLESNTDATTFVPYGDSFVVNATDPVNYTSVDIPATAGHFLAVRFVTTAAHQSLILDNFKWLTDSSFTPCTPITTLDENFSSFTDFPQNCWTASHSYPNFSLSDNNENNAILFYSSTNQADNFYIVTPELVTIPADKALSFDAVTDGANSFDIAVGTLANPDDYTSFTQVGATVTLSSSTVTYVSEAIGNTSNKYLALKLIPSIPHQVISLDNIKLADPVSDTSENPSAIQQIDTKSFKVYPNPFTNQVNVASDDDITSIILLDVTGREILNARPQGKTFSYNSSRLPQGTYMLNILTKKGMATVKIVK